METAGAYADALNCVGAGRSLLRAELVPALYSRVVGREGLRWQAAVRLEDLLEELPLQVCNEAAWKFFPGLSEVLLAVLS